MKTLHRLFTALALALSLLTAPAAYLGSTNLIGINGVTPVTGNGVTSTGSLRVTIASDNTAFPINSIQSGTWNLSNISGTISLPTGAEPRLPCLS